MIVELTLRQAAYIAHNMRDDDYAEVMATRWTDDPDQFAIDAMRYPGSGYCLLDDDGIPVVMGGVAVHTPKVGNAWMVATNDINNVALEITRYARDLMQRLLNEGAVNRIQALSAEFHEDAHRWLEAIGFHVETPVPNMGKGGEDFIMYVITN